MKDIVPQTGNGFLSFWKREPDWTVKSILSAATPQPILSSSDTTSSSDGAEQHTHEGPSDFVIECQHGEMVFVTAAQGKAVLQRSNYFRVLFRVGSGDRIVKKPEWSLATARRMIELLTTGRSWIENDASCFSRMVEAAKEVAVELRLGSLINNHDTLEQEDTHKFFRMINLEKYQFKIQTKITSWQWMTLMHRGILLLLKSKVIMIKTAPSISEKVQSRPPPTNERLMKCNSMCSEFCVYADGNISALLDIMDILCPLTNPKDVLARRMQPEEYRLVYYTREGKMTKEDLDMIWRITDASYTAAPEEDRKYLQPISSYAQQAEPSNNNISTTNGRLGSAESNNKALVQAKKGESSPHETYELLPAILASSSSPSPLSTSTSTSTAAVLHCRAITCTSLLVMKHVFDNINKEDGHLPACLLISSPTPDTLGRLINATNQQKRTCQDDCNDNDNELGMDMDRNLFYTSKSSHDVKRTLDCLADYSSSAVVRGDFKLVEFQNPSSLTTTTPPPPRDNNSRSGRQGALHFGSILRS
jgi:hypothetical protein